SSAVSSSLAGPARVSVSCTCSPPARSESTTGIGLRPGGETAVPARRPYRIARISHPCSGVRRAATSWAARRRGPSRSARAPARGGLLVTLLRAQFADSLMHDRHDGIRLARQHLQCAVHALGVVRLCFDTGSAAAAQVEQDARTGASCRALGESRGAGPQTGG